MESEIGAMVGSSIRRMDFFLFVDGKEELDDRTLRNICQNTGTVAANIGVYYGFLPLKYRKLRVRGAGNRESPIQ